MTLGYYVEISDPFGIKLAQTDSFTRLEYARVVNGIGSLTLELDPDSDLSLYRLDGRIGVWRDAGAGYTLDTDTVWLIRKWRRTLSTTGERKLYVMAYSASELLVRRIVAYAAGTAPADKSDFADDMLKEIVRENLGDLAPADRDVSALFSVQEELGFGYEVQKAFSRRNMLTVLQEISDASAQNGIPLFFDLIAPIPGWLEFRTFTGQRGVDRSLASGVSPLILSPERGTVAGGDLTDDYSDEATLAYAAGQGEGVDRVVVEGEDVSRSQQSPLNRREILRDARHIADTAKLPDEAATALRENRPRRVFSGSLINTPQVRYGIEWHWGDKVTVQFEGATFDSDINAIRVTVTDGGETIDAALRTEEWL